MKTWVKWLIGTLGSLLFVFDLGCVVYSVSPTAKDWIDSKLLKHEQIVNAPTGDNTSESDDELLLELESVKVALESANKTIADKDSELAIKAEALVEANNQLNAKQEIIDTLTSEKLTLEAEIAGLENELEACNGENAELQAELEAKQTELANVNSQLETANSDKTELQAEVTDLSNQVTELMSQVSTLESEKETLQARVDELEEYIKKDDSVLHIEDISGNVNIFKFTSGEYALFNSNDKFTLYLVNLYDYSIEDSFYYSSSVSLNKCIFLKNDDAILFTTSSCPVNFVYYNHNERSIEVVHTDSDRFFTQAVKFSDDNILFHNYSNDDLFYNHLTGEFTDCNAFNCKAQQIRLINLTNGDGFLNTESSSNYGASFYDSSESSFTQIFSEGNPKLACSECLSNGKCIINYYKNGYDGVYTLDIETKELEMIIPGNIRCSSFVEDGDIATLTCYDSGGGIVYYYYNMETGAVATNREDVEPDVIDGTYYFEMVSGSETMYKMSFTLTQSEIASHEEISDPYEAMSYEISKTDNVVTLNVRTLVTDESGSTLADETNHFTLTFNTETEEWTVACEETLAEDITVNFYSEADINDAGAGDDGYQEKPDMNEPEL